MKKPVQNHDPLRGITKLVRAGLEHSLGKRGLLESYRVRASKMRRLRGMVYGRRSG